MRRRRRSRDDYLLLVEAAEIVGSEGLELDPVLRGKTGILVLEYVLAKLKRFPSLVVVPKTH